MHVQFYRDKLGEVDLIVDIRIMAYAIAVVSSRQPRGRAMARLQTHVKGLKMRVHIYQEELGEGVELIEQTSRNGEHFYGLRIWLKTCQPLLDHSTPEDDDRSAVTFWAADRESLYSLASLMREAIEAD